jgi:hypothetical protein
MFVPEHSAANPEHQRAKPSHQLGERGLVASTDEPGEELAVGDVRVVCRIDGPANPGNGCGQGWVGHGLRLRDRPTWLASHLAPGRSGASVEKRKYFG